LDARSDGVTQVAELIDVAIVGGGPAGLAAGIYAARARRSTVVFERNIIGGQIATSGDVENYPGFPDGVNGLDLALAMQRQAEQFGAELRAEGVTSIRAPEAEGGAFLLATDSGEVRARTVIVSAGADYNRLGVPGEDTLLGKGVSYCATCDAAFFRDVPAIVVGGGDSAVEEALFTTRYASKVWLIHRREELRASRILRDRLLANPKVEVVWNTVVDRINGDDDAVTSATLRDVRTGATRELAASAVFIFIGQTPNSGILRGLTTLDEGGHARVNLWMETDLPGLYAAGDIRIDAARQLASSAGDGVTAAIRAEHYLADHFG
jgi:thioredoxin reductase (NADPH)